MNYYVEKKQSKCSVCGGDCCWFQVVDKREKDIIKTYDILEESIKLFEKFSGLRIDWKKLQTTCNKCYNKEERTMLLFCNKYPKITKEELLDYYKLLE